MGYINFSKELKRLWKDIKSAKWSYEIKRDVYLSKHRRYREKEEEDMKRARQELDEAYKAMREFKEKYNLK